MAWNDKGGPWGQPAGGNEPRGRQPNTNGPPDFEAMLRRGQDRMRDFLPGGVGGGRAIGLIVAVLGAIWLATGIYRVDPNEEGVVQRFGAWVRTETLGLHYHWPAPIESVTMVDVTGRHQTEIGYHEDRGNGEFGTMLTSDRNILEVDFVVVWQVRDPAKFIFDVAEPESILRRAGESAMREVIGQTDVQPALNEGRLQVEAEAAKILQATLDRYQSGIEVEQIQLQRVDPPTPVVEAFNDVQRARSELEQQRNEAEKYRNDILPRARGEAQKIVQDAQAYRDRVMAEATGESQQFLSVLDAYRQSRDVTQRRLYIETMQAILEHAKKLILDPSIDAKNGVVPYLPLPGLQSEKPDLKP